MLAVISKDPDARLDYTIDWSQWLVDDTIQSSAWVADPGLTISDGAYSPTNSDTKASVWLEGGTPGARYRVRNRITTTGGRTDDRTIEVKVEER